MSSLTMGNRFGRNTTVQSENNRPNSLTSGHRACQGCGEALAARCSLDAAYIETKGNIAVVNATGCLEVFSCAYPENSWNIPWVHSLFGNAAAVASGVAAAFKSQKKDIRVIAQGGDGGTTDIGMACLSGMFERNDDVLYICYDNEAYMNTGVQRSSATLTFARTATTLPNGQYMGNDIRTGKNVPEIAMAHGIPYVASASIGDIHDLEKKVKKAIHIKGAKYIQIHSPCPLGWGYPTENTIQLAKLAIKCGLYPLFEAENGVVVNSTAIDNIISVESYLKGQKRFAHLFGKNAQVNSWKVIQELANNHIRKYKLGEVVYE